MARTTQCKKILRWFKKRKSISPAQAMSKLGIYRLAARIMDLEAAGYKFMHIMVHKRDENGDPVKYMTYWLVRE